MKIYLVGGAVRDELLNYPVTERDWVVVGGSPSELQSLQYQQVGRDFPVFLHPQSHEEYALARRERKRAPGYYGFECEFGPEVSLEEDLSRRDLTINAMAKTTDGSIIDPYNGQNDLRDRLLRHVSPAFVEDPVRVLRIARFAARYHHLGFTVANETKELMIQMAAQGELNHLVAERVWQELYRSLQEKNPEVFFEVLRSCGALSMVFPEIDALFGIPNNCIHHPEIDSGIHTLMVLMEAVKLSKDTDIRFAALVHDLGKTVTPVNLWPKHVGHEKAGKKMITSFCQRFRVPQEYKHLALLTSEFHLMIHKVKELRSSTIVSMLERCDVFRRPEIFDKLLVACEADGRGRLLKTDYTQADQWREIKQMCRLITAKEVMEEGIKGPAIKQALHERRVQAVNKLLKVWNNNEK